ncbi:hypothetical protein QTP88_009298 [Uroleucon formosanum]
MSSQQPNTSNSSSSNRSTYHRCEIRSVIRSLILRNESAASLHRQLVETYRSEVMTRQHVTKWVRLFKEGRTHTHDEEERKIMASVFWDWKVLLLVDFMPKRTTINAARCCETLKKSKKKIKDKRRVKLTRGVSLLHDNARPHRPSHSGPACFIWEFLGGQRFSNDEKVQDAVENWLREVEREGIRRGYTKTGP